jgi:DnaJ like chaperone protein
MVFSHPSLNSLATGMPDSTEAPDKHYEVLGCTKDNSDKEIKKAYRKAISKHHPDKIQSEGLPKEFMYM